MTRALVALLALVPFALAADPPRVDLYGDPLPAGAVAQLGTVHRSGENMRNFHFAADGKTFHASARGPAWVQFDATTGKRIRVTVFAGLEGSWPWVSADGSTAVVEQPGGHFHVLDVPTGKVYLSTPASAIFRHFGDPFSPDGRFFAAAERAPVDAAFRGSATPQILTVYEVRGGRTWRLGPHTDHVRAVRFLSDGSRAFVFGGRTASYWDIANQKELWNIPWPEHQLVPLVRPDGKVMLLPAGHQRPAMRLLDTATGLPAVGLNAPPGGHAYHFTDDRHVLVTHATHRELWDTREGKSQPTNEQSVYGNLSPDRTRSVWAGWRSRVQLYDVKTNTAVYADRPTRGHDCAVVDAAFDPVTGRIVTLDDRGYLRAWDRDGTGKLVGAYQDSISAGGAIVPRRDGKRWVIQNRPDDRTGTIRVVAPQTGRGDVWTRYPDDPVGGYVRPARAHLSADGASVRTAYHHLRYPEKGPPSSHLVFQTLDAKTGKLTRTREVPVRPLVRHGDAAISPDGRLVTDARTVCEFDTGQVVARLSRAGEVPYGEPEFSADGRFLAVRMRSVGKWTPPLDDGFGRFGRGPPAIVEEEPSEPLAGRLPHVWVWDVVSGRVVGRITVGADHMRITPNGRFLVTLDATGVSAWDIATGRQVVHHRPDPRKLEFEGRDQTAGLAVSPDGALAVTTRFDRTALVWDMSGAMRVANRAPLTADELATAWATFTDGKPESQFARMWRLVDRSDAALPFLRDRVKAGVVPFTPPAPGTLRALVADLDDDDFATRESAEKTLGGLGEACRTTLADAVRGTKSPEQKMRLTRLLTKLDTSPVAELRKEDVPLAWALAALERIGTPEARDVIRVMASGPPASRLTREANAALDRTQ